MAARPERDDHVRERRGCAAVAVVAIAAFLALGVPAEARAAGSSSTFRVSLTILPAVDASRLPAAVQRLDVAWPGYADAWAHARSVAGHEPLQAVRALRARHAAMRGRPDWQAWEPDMVAAGQALFRRDGGDVATLAGSPGA